MVANRATILIVDDEPDGREALALLFRDAGYEPRLAATLDEAVRLLRAGLRPHVVIVEMMIPGRLGVLGAAIAHHRDHRAHLLFYSRGDDVARAARLAGIAGGVTKPDFTKLLDLVRRLVEQPATSH
jgi:DNA-binding NtrC family response regulator